MRIINNILKIRNPETGAFEALPGVLGNVVDMIYPVGSIYMSVNAASPATLFGGEWEQIKDTFLLSAGDTYTAGATGGEAEHTLTEDEMPKHSHNLMLYANNTGSSTVPAGYCALNSNTYTWTTSGASGKNSGLFGKANSTGNDQPHNNMPPYLAVYMWKRTA